MIKKIMAFFKDVSADFFSEIWTFVGLFSAWLVLTGSAKVVIGKVIMIGFIVWIIRNRIKDFSGKE